MLILFYHNYDTKIDHTYAWIHNWVYTHLISFCRSFINNDVYDSREDHFYECYVVTVWNLSSVCFITVVDFVNFLIRLLSNFFWKEDIIINKLTRRLATFWSASLDV